MSDTLNLITDTKQLNSAIAKIKTVGDKLDASIHLVACSVIAHVTAHRNTTPMADLLKAMPKSSRLNGLIKWFSHYMPVTINPTTLAVSIPKESSDDWETYLAEANIKLEEAISCPFWEYKPETAKKEIDLDVIIKYLSTKSKSKTIAADVADKITKIQKFAETLKG